MKASCTQTIDLDAFIMNILTYFTSYGIKLEIGTNFSDYSDALMHQQGRHDIRPTFSKENRALNAKNAFWIIGRNNADEIVHTQAAYCFELNGLSLADYFEKHVKEFSSFKEDHNKLRFCPGPNSSGITGTVCYHGEFWLNIGPSRCGSSGIATLLSKLAMAISLQRWNIDCFFAFMMALKACRGLAARGGYLHAEPNSVVWEIPEKAELQESWLVWTNKRDIQHLIEMTPALLAHKIIPQKRDVAAA